MTRIRKLVDCASKLKLISKPNHKTKIFNKPLNLCIDFSLYTNIKSSKKFKALITKRKAFISF